MYWRLLKRRWLAGFAFVDKKSRGAVEIFEQEFLGRFVLNFGFDGEAHVVDPGIAFALADGEGKVAHSQTRMTTLRRIVGGAAAILNDEECRPPGAFTQIFGVHRAQDGVAFHTSVEVSDHPHQWFLAAREFIDRLLAFVFGGG